MDPLSPLKESDVEIIKNLLAEIHQHFKDHVKVFHIQKDVENSLKSKCVTSLCSFFRPSSDFHITHCANQVDPSMVL